MAYYVIKEEGEKWESKTKDPDKWKVVLMTQKPLLYKVVGEDGKNIAAEFASQTDALVFIEHNKVKPKFACIAENDRWKCGTLEKIWYAGEAYKYHGKLATETDQDVPLPAETPTEEPETPTEEPETPTGLKLVYDSNVDGEWNNGVERTADHDTDDGDVGPDGKGLYTAASGSPKFTIDGKGIGTLKTSPGFGRIYICVTNYNVVLEHSFNIKSGTVDNLSQKLRSRHQEDLPCENRFGGFGSSIGLDEIKMKTESCHNFHENSTSGKLSKKLSLNTWYKSRFEVKDVTVNGKTAVQSTQWIDYNDGKGFIQVHQQKHTSPKDYYLDKASFNEQSYLWLRLNGSGEIAFKDVKVWEIN